MGLIDAVFIAENSNVPFWSDKLPNCVVARLSLCVGDAIHEH